MNTGNSYLKYVAMVMGIIFLIAATFLFVTLWQNSQQNVDDTGYVYDTLTYEGREYVRKERVETFLLLGLDRYADSQVSDAHGTGVQADFLLLMVLDNDTKQCTALQVNRDAMTKVNKLSIGGTAVVQSYTAQIALAYNAVNDDNEKIRCRNTVDSLEYLLPGVDVDHYFALTMDAVAASCDAVGGVEITVLDDFTGIDDTLVKGETVMLNGQQALRYVRTRYGMEDSTNSTRMERQRQYLDALYQRIFEKMNSDQGFALELAQALDGHVAYDSSDRRMQMLLEKIHEYEYLGIRQLEGQTVQGEEFMEFYPEEASVLKTVIDLYYTPKTNGD